MSDRSHINWGRLASYLSGDLPPLEREDVERWIAERDEHRAIMGQLRAAWTVIQPVQLTALDIAELQRQVMRQIGAGTQASRTARRKEGLFFGRPLRRRGWYGAAGALVAVFLVIMAWTGVTHHVKSDAPSAMTSYATANGQRATITLADGSTVLLDVASRLTVPVDYARGDHAVRLIGDALFTVSHHDRAPFTVLAGTAVTRVLGTSFVVRHYGSDTMTMVAVRDGKVTVGTTIVPAGRLVELGPDGIARVRPADESSFSFATGVLALRSLSLAQAIPELDRWYDADIRLGDAALATEPIDGNVVAGSLTDLANLLTLTFNVRVVRDGRILTLYPR